LPPHSVIPSGPPELIYAGDKTTYLFKEMEAAKNAGGHQAGSPYFKSSCDFLLLIIPTYQFQAFKFWMASFLQSHSLFEISQPEKGDTHGPASCFLPLPLHFHFLVGFQP
jgi:hypothetical protein